MSSHSRTPTAPEIATTRAANAVDPELDCYPNVPATIPLYHALIPVAELAQLRADLAAAQAERDQWRARYLEYRQIVLLVEEFADNRDQPTAMALIDAFNAFRAFVEGGKPREWVVGAPEPEPGGGCIDEWEPGAGADAEEAPWV